MYIFQDLPKSLEDNAGGLLSNVQLIPANANILGSYYPLYYSESNLVVDNTSFIDDNPDWKKFGFISETCSFESQSKEANGVTTFETTFKGKLPSINSQGVQVLMSFLKSRCLAVVSDTNGRRRIIGRIDTPAGISFRETIGEKYESLSCIEVSIFLTAALPPAFLP